MGMRQAFQFHKGTIRTGAKVHSCNIPHHFNSIKVRLELLVAGGVLPGFQFHKGTIRTVVLLLLTMMLNDFNSIKVRLEQRKPYRYFFAAE